MDAHDNHRRTHRVTEHGQDWLVCLDCGASWSIVETEINGEPGEDLEEISDGDGWCEDELRRQLTMKGTRA